MRIFPGDWITRIAILVVTAIITLGLSTLISQSPSAADQPLKIPFNKAMGATLFKQYCSSCHGETLVGTDKGPPLLHPYYVPSHHGDAAFYRAAKMGVQAHHWQFGDMPRVETISDNEIVQVVEFIRWYQQESGLY